MNGIATSRLDLVPATVTLLEAELESDARLALLLSAHVPDGWPPGEYDRPAIMHFRDCLAKNPDAVGWYGWYALVRSEGKDPRILVGAGGYLAPPSAEGLVEIGYSVLRAFEGRGYATEIVRALVGHAFATGRVKRIIAHTRRENVGSVNVLERAGLHFAGVGDDPEIAEYAQNSPAT